MFESSSDEGAEVKVGTFETEGLDVGRMGAKVGGSVGRIGEDVGGTTKLDVGASDTNEYPGVFGTPWNSWSMKLTSERAQQRTLPTHSYHSLHRDQMTVMFLERSPQLLAAPTQVHGILYIRFRKCEFAPTRVLFACVRSRFTDTVSLRLAGVEALAPVLSKRRELPA